MPGSVKPADQLLLQSKSTVICRNSHAHARTFFLLPNCDAVLRRSRPICCVTVGQNHSVVLTYPSRGNRIVGSEQFGQHLDFFLSGYQKQDPTRTVEDWIRECHSPPTHVDAGERDVYIRHAKHRITRNERSGVAVRPHTQVSEI